MTDDRKMVVVRDGKRQELATEEARRAAIKEAADAERQRIRDEGYQAGLKQGRHEAHHARKYVLAGIIGFCLIIGGCAGAMMMAGAYERGMSAGAIAAAIGGGVGRDAPPRLTIDGVTTREEDVGWARGRRGWEQPDGDVER